MVFTSDYFIEQSNMIFDDFVNKFRMKYGKTPGLAAVYGYDCMRLFLNTIKQGALTREEVKDKLSNIDIFRGVKSNIAFDEYDRTNRFAKILKYYRTKIIEIK